MVIFHSYISLPEGMKQLQNKVRQHQVQQAIGRCSGCSDCHRQAPGSDGDPPSQAVIEKEQP